MKHLFAALALGALLTTSVAPAQAQEDRRLIIYNDTDQDMYNMYVSNVGSDTWGPDQFGRSGVLQAHHYIAWNIDDGSGYCRFDFKFVDENNAKYLKRDYNVCTQVVIHIVDDN